MSTGFLLTCGAIVLLAIPYLARVRVGPNLFDRVVGLNAIGTMIPLLLVLTGLLYRRLDMFVDIALAVLLLNQFTTLLIARYIRKRETESGK